MTTRSSVARRSAGGFTLLEVMAAVLILGIWFTVLAGVAIQGLRAEGEADRRLRAELVADARMSELEGAAQVGALPPIGEDQATQDDFQIHTRVAVLDLPTVAAAAAAGGPAPAGSGGATAGPDAAAGASGGSSGGASGSGSSAARSGANALASRLAAQRAARSASRPGASASGVAGGASGGGAGTTAAGAAAGATAAALPANASFFAPTPGGGAPPLRQLQVEVVWDEGGIQRSVIRTSYALDPQAAAPLLQALDQLAQQTEAATESASEEPRAPAGGSDQENEGQQPEASQ